MIWERSRVWYCDYAGLRFRLEAERHEVFLYYWESNRSKGSWVPLVNKTVNNMKNQDVKRWATKVLSVLIETGV